VNDERAARAPAGAATSDPALVLMGLSRARPGRAHRRRNGRL